MAKKRKQDNIPEEDKTVSEFYRLNLKAVDDLVTADVSNSPKVSEEELRKYRSGPKLRLADWTKALLIKTWFAGAVCFFFLWGLGIYISDQLDQMVIVSLALGVVWDLLCNPLFRFYAKTEGENDRWMMFPKKKYVTLPLNIIYAFLLMIFVVTTYNVLNRFILLLTGAKDTVPLGVGPILFGVFVTLWDQFFIWVKHTVKKMADQAKKTAGQQMSNQFQHESAQGGK